MTRKSPTGSERWSGYACPPPLAPTVFPEICRSADTIGLGFRSLINAVLAYAGDSPIAEVVKVSSCRSVEVAERDPYGTVEALTAAGESIAIQIVAPLPDDVEGRPLSGARSFL